MVKPHLVPGVKPGTLPIVRLDRRFPLPVAGGAHGR
jgi:hypothetical protein